MRAWLIAFLFTQACEVPIYAAALRGKYGISRAVGLAFVASLLTHPIVWFVLPAVGRVLGHTGYVVVAEIFALVAEAAFLGMLRVPRPFALSLLANGASLGLGLLSRTVFGVP